MKIGILSDTHNNIELTRQALAQLRSRNINFIIHAGDITSPIMLSEFTGFKCIFVFGNGDLDRETMAEEVRRLNLGTIAETVIFKKKGKRFIVFHGNDVPLFRKAVASEEYDYIIKGHTHHFENYVSNKSRIINPGSLYGRNEASIAILETDSDTVEMVRIEE